MNGHVRPWSRITILFAFFAFLWTGCGSYSNPVTTPPPSPQVAYVVKTFDNNVSIFATDSTTGQLRASGTVSSGGTTPVSIASDALMAHLWVL